MLQQEIDFSRSPYPVDGVTSQDVKDFGKATQRIFELMKDGSWYSVDEINAAAGKNGRPAREGLRRMRALRAKYTIELKKADGRNFLYRLLLKENND